MERKDRFGVTYILHLNWKFLTSQCAGLEKQVTSFSLISHD